MAQDQTTSPTPTADGETSAEGAASTTGQASTSGDVRTLLTGLVDDRRNLVRGELRLARAEVREDATEAGQGVAVLGAGALAGLVGFVFLALGRTYALSRRLPRWAAATAVGLGLPSIAAALGLAGKRRLRTERLVPEQTLASLKENVTLLRRRVTGGE